MSLGWHAIKFSITRVESPSIVRSVQGSTKMCAGSFGNPLTSGRARIGINSPLYLTNLSQHLKTLKGTFKWMLRRGKPSRDLSRTQKFPRLLDIASNNRTFIAQKNTLKWSIFLIITGHLLFDIINCIQVFIVNQVIKSYTLKCAAYQESDSIFSDG